MRQKKPEILPERFLRSYALDEMTTIYLPNELKEISGLEWIGKDQLWAVEDESAEIFKIDPKSGEIIEKIRFGKKSDFEDLVVIDGTAWILQSDGNIYRVKNPFAKTSETIIFEFPNIGKSDMEAMLVSEEGKALWLLCKECEIDKSSEGASVFRFDLETLQFDSQPFHKLGLKDFKPILLNQNSKKLKIQPSAAAFHPTENKIYMISSTGKWISILNADLNPLEMLWLDPHIFKQPEGITFDPTGNLYISNEAAGNKPNLLIFRYNP